MTEQEYIELTNQNIEIFLQLKVNKNYTISNFGRVKNSVDKEIKAVRSKPGYYSVSLDKKKYSLARLVAETFLVESFRNDRIIKHRDRIPSNNKLTNLEVSEKKYNKGMSGLKIKYNRQYNNYSIGCVIYQTLEEAKEALSRNKI